MQQISNYPTKFQRIYDENPKFQVYAIIRWYVRPCHYFWKFQLKFRFFLTFDRGCQGYHRF